MSQARTCCVHNHCNLCDGKDSPAAMAAAALGLGIETLGFSSHSHTPAPWDQYYVLPPDSTAYRAEVLRLRKEYRGWMDILCGLEWDGRADVPHTGWDYWIGSVHSLRIAGRDYAVDLSREALETCRDQGCAGDMYAVAEAYFREVAAVAALRPTILGHLDLVGKFNEDIVLFDQDHPRYRTAALTALRAADPAATLLEINTGAISRGYRTAPYPAPFLLEEWRRLGGRVILTSDAHCADHLLFGYDLAAEVARHAGFRESWLLTADGMRPAAL